MSQTRAGEVHSGLLAGSDGVHGEKDHYIHGYDAVKVTIVWPEGSFLWSVA